LERERIMHKESQNNEPKITNPRQSAGSMEREIDLDDDKLLMLF
jgi:hypothetical protein